MEESLPLGNIEDVVARRLIAQAEKENLTESQPTTTAAGVAVAERPPLPITFTKIEKNLAELGFFTPSSKRLKNTKAKIVVIKRTIDGKRVEATVTFVPGALYGLPITADQDKYLAFQDLVTDQQQRDGIVANPIGFTSAELLQLLGLCDSGKNYKDVGDWLDVMASTTIVSEGAVYFAGQKRSVKDRFHVFERAVSLGKELPDGTVADKNYVWYSEWQLENINNHYLLRVDLETYRHLKNHIAKALVPLLQVWLYASQNDRVFEKDYDELCQILNVRVYRHRSQILEQLAPSLDELKARGYLTSWALVRASRRAGWKVVFRHGEKFFADQRPRPRIGAERRHSSGTGHAAPQPGTEAPAVSATGSSLSSALLADLASRGVVLEKLPPTLLATLTDDRVSDCLRLFDGEVQRKRWTNPAGLLVDMLRGKYAFPPDFETTAQRQEREARAAAAEREREAHERAMREQHDAYAAFCEERLQQHLANLTLEAARAYDDRLKRKEDELRRGFMENAQAHDVTRAAQGIVHKEIAREIRIPSFVQFSAELANDSAAKRSS